LLARMESTSFKRNLRAANVGVLIITGSIHLNMKIDRQHRSCA